MVEQKFQFVLEAKKIHDFEKSWIAFKLPMRIFIKNRQT